MNQRRLAADAGWTLGALLGALALVSAAILAAGYVAGAPRDPGTGPTVDLAEPPGEVVADALADLRYRDHVLEWHLVVTNRTAGTSQGGLAFRAHIEHSERRVRLRVWPTALSTPPDDRGLSTVFFGTDALKYEGTPERGHWARIVDGGVRYDEGGVADLGMRPAVLRNATWAVSENESALVLRQTDPAVLRRTRPNENYRRNASMTVVVAKGEDPRLRRVTFVNRTAGARETFVVREYGTATAPRPNGVPPVTVTEVLARSVRGLERLS